jgi:tricorn protease
MKLLATLLAFSCTALAADPPPRIDARMLQTPAVSATQLAFVYAGDIWIAPKDGGDAVRLSTPRGSEQFPRFSPDGTRLAFSGNYEGDTDLYSIPVTGGEPLRLTHHGANDRMLGWYPDGQSILFASKMASFTERVNQLYRIAATGGLPERLPVPYGEFGAISPDGKRLAYTMIDTSFATWKRYRGGMAPDIWIYDLEKGTAELAAPSDANDSQPMWHGATLYFLSDRGEGARANLWNYDPATKAVRQVTHFLDHDVRFPSIGPADIVFESHGRLHLLDLATEDVREIDITLVTDRATLRPRVVGVGGEIRNSTLTPTGKRVLLEARGDIFSMPVENGVVRNLTESSGVAERYPSASPDGKWVAYFSDRSGEYELCVRPADGKGSEIQITKLGPGYRYQPQWSPDSKKLVFIDQAMRIYHCDLAAKKWNVVGRQMWMYHGDLTRFTVSWSADSRYFAYAADQENRQTAIAIVDTVEKKAHRVTSGYYDEDLPVFDPAGKYLYYRARRWFDPIYSELDNTWIYANGQALVAVPLQRDTPSPLAPRNDEEPVKKEEKKPAEPRPATTAPGLEGTWKGTVALPDEELKFTLTLKVAADGAITGSVVTAKGERSDVTGKLDATGKAFSLTSKLAEQSVTFEGKLEGDTFSGTARVEDADLTVKATREPAPTVADTKPAPPANPAPRPVAIDLEGFEARGVILPPNGGRFEWLGAVPGKLLFTRAPRVGSNTNTYPLAVYDFEKREEKPLHDDAPSLELSADGKRLLIVKGNTWRVIGSADAPKFDKTLATGTLEARIDPAAEWKQIFTDAWRIQRDFFYDPKLHGVDWPAQRERYGKLIDDCVTRSDVNYVLGELLGELNSSHTYRSGGDLQDTAPSRTVGYLGCDFALEQGAYRIVRILEGASWDLNVRSPLRQPGVKVKSGDWLLAVNGRPLDTSKDPWAAFLGLAGKTVFLTVNDRPVLDGAREVLVQPIASESDLRQYAWIEENRRRVDAATGGQIGYIYVLSTAIEGQNQLVRQFRAQVHKPGLIIDERWNSGGQIPDRFVELLSRKVTNYYAVRDGRDWQSPFIAHSGPKAMLANGWSGSGGDCFPFLFRQMNLGPLIGTRTWGGLIGMTGSPRLIDGGEVTVPTFAIYDRAGKWIIEGYGVDPDIAVPENPADLAKGRDAQLERAIAEVQKALKARPVTAPKRPEYPVR